MAINELKTRIVLRNDSTANWTEKDPVLMKGEIGFDMDLLIFKVGDGVKKWSEITKTFKSYEDIMTAVNEAIQNAVNGLHTTVTFTAEVALGADKLAALEGVAADAAQGDIGIVKEQLADGKFQYTAYVYDGEKWEAMDGNYDAENVYFQKDLTITANIGVQTIPSSGSKTLATTGKNIKQVLDMIVASEKNPSTTQPTATLNSSNIGSKEVGTKIAVAYAFATSAGSYTYGPATGVTFSDYTAMFNGEEKTGATGTFTEITVADDTNLTITGSCSSTEGAIPKTNLGNEYPAGKIAAKTYSPSKGTLTGFRGWFYGYYNGTQAIADPAAITSTQLRTFGTKTSFPTSLSTTKMQQMFFAAPKGKVTTLSISNAVNGAPLTVTKGAVQVEGANGYAAVDYDLFYVANAVAEGGDSKWTISAK